jgi:6-phosphofructokinase 1
MTEKTIKTIALMTSGGDSPGMNCVIRSVVRTAIGNGIKVFGINRGFAGLLENNLTDECLICWKYYSTWWNSSIFFKMP